MQRVFVYEPIKQANIEYFSERNIGLAKYIAKITGREFGGVYNPRTMKAPHDAFWLINGPIPHEEAEALGVTGWNFFGGIVDLLYAQKSVFHLPVPHASQVPDTFPLAFTKHLDDEGVLLPGYTAFSVEDAYTAYDLLVKEGYIPRLKDPLKSASTGQYRLESRRHLTSVLEKLDKKILPKYGVVLEANMIGKHGSDLDSLSGGWVQLNDRTYTSVGFMSFDHTNITPFGIISSNRFVIRGDDPLQFLDVVDKRYHKEARLLASLNHANSLLPRLRATRRNYNFIAGQFEMSDGTQSEETLRASEPTFRPGGASGAELLAAEYLATHPNVNVVHTKCQIHYGDKEDIDIPDHAVMIHQGRYEGPGRYDPHISVATQVFAQVIEAF